MSTQSVLNVVYLALGLAIALAVHEYAHAWTATRLGDPTPRLSGRLTLDPRKHADPFGTLLLPGLLLLPVLFGSANLFVFGYAKPQPLNPWALRGHDRHTSLVAMAGPAANLVAAFVLGLAFRALGAGSGQLGSVVGSCLVVNVIVAAMNLIPIPPLDMTRVVARLLSPRAREVLTNMEQYAALFMLVVFFIVAGPIFAFVRVIGNGICQITAGARCLL